MNSHSDRWVDRSAGDRVGGDLAEGEQPDLERPGDTHGAVSLSAVKSVSQRCKPATTAAVRPCPPGSRTRWWCFPHRRGGRSRSARAGRGDHHVGVAVGDEHRKAGKAAGGGEMVGERDDVESRWTCGRGADRPGGAGVVLPAPRDGFR